MVVACCSRKHCGVKKVMIGTLNFIIDFFVYVYINKVGNVSSLITILKVDNAMT